MYAYRAGANRSKSVRTDYDVKQVNNIISCSLQTSFEWRSSRNSIRLSNHRDLSEIQLHILSLQIWEDYIYDKNIRDCLKDHWRKETSLQTFHEGNAFMDSVKFIHLFSQLLSMRKVTTFPPPSPSLSFRMAPKRHLNELTLMKAQALLLLFFFFFDFGS